MSQSRLGFPLALTVIVVAMGCQTTRPAVPSAGRLLPRLATLPTEGAGQAKARPPAQPPGGLAQAPTPKPLQNDQAKPMRGQDPHGDDLVVRATNPPLAPPLPPSSVPEARPSEPSTDKPPVPPLPGAPSPRETSKSDVAELDKLRDLHRVAAMKYAQIDDYVTRFRCREVVNGKQMRPELLMLKFKKNPDSRYLKWLKGAASEGREVIYVNGKYQNQLQVRTGKSDPIAGLRLEMDPHSPRATANSRRTLDDSGIGKLVERFGVALASVEQGDLAHGTLRPVGLRDREESPGVPMECVVQEVPPGREKHLPTGGKRHWYFVNNPASNDHGLPTLVTTEDEQGREVEYYCYDLVNVNVGLRDEDFDPARVWRK